MKSLRWVGFVFSLLIVGVLGGLMAALPAEAANTTVTLQADNGAPINILGSSVPCTDTANYNQCFSISSALEAVGNNGRRFKVRAAPNAQPRLNLNDRLPARGKASGVEFYPTTTAWGCNNGAAGSNNCAIRDEVHVLKVVVRNKYLAAGSGSSFTIGLRSGGLMSAGPSTSTICGLQPTGVPQLCHNQYNRMEFKGTGEFDSSTSTPPTALLGVAPANPTVKSIQEANKSQTTTWTTQLDQAVQYPTNLCNTGTPSAPACQPTITMMYTATLFGPDFSRLNDSNDWVGCGCNHDPQGPPGGNPAIPCHSTGKKKNSCDDSIKNEFDEYNVVDLMAAEEAGAVQAVQCTAADNCPCADLDTCFGTIVINLKVTPGTAGTFNVTGTGGGIGNPTPETPTIYPITTKTNGRGSLTFNNLPITGAPWVIAEGPFDPIDSLQTDQINCVSQKNDPSAIPPIIVSSWTVNPGSDKSPLTVTQLGDDKITCEWHLH